MKAGNLLAMERRQTSRASGFHPAPVEETKKRHQKKRFGIAGDEKESGGMRQNDERAEQLPTGRQVPSFAEKEEIGPKTPGGALGGN